MNTSDEVDDLRRRNETLTSALMLVVESIERTRQRVPPEGAPIFIELDIAASACRALLGGSTLALDVNLPRPMLPATADGRAEVWRLIGDEVEPSVRDDIGRLVLGDIRERQAESPIYLDTGMTSRAALVFEYHCDLDALVARRLAHGRLVELGLPVNPTEHMLYRTRLNFLAQVRRLIAVQDMFELLNRSIPASEIAMDVSTAPEVQHG